MGLIGLIFLKSIGANASILDEIGRIDEEKNKTFQKTDAEIKELEIASIPKPAKPPIPFKLATGDTVNLRDYKLVLFMQKSCGECHKFDPQFKQMIDAIKFPTMVYTLDGFGDDYFPAAIPAPQAVMDEFGAYATPMVFLVNVNTMGSYLVAKGNTPINEVFKYVQAGIYTDIKNGKQ